MPKWHPRSIETIKRDLEMVEAEIAYLEERLKDPSLSESDKGILKNILRMKQYRKANLEAKLKALEKLGSPQQQ